MPIFVSIAVGAIPVAKWSGLGTLPAMAGRRGWGEDIYFDHSGECRDPETHRHCQGRWRGVVSLKPGPDGQRRRKKVSGRNKTEVRAKLTELHDELNDGVITNASYTVAQAIKDWLADGLAGRAPKTVSTRPRASLPETARAETAFAAGSSPGTRDDHN
jgi:hypothetical protein